MAHDTHESHTFGHDARAAFMGLVIGAIVLFGLVRVIVAFTTAKYTHEKPAAAETK